MRQNELIPILIAVVFCLTTATDSAAQVILDWVKTDTLYYSPSRFNISVDTAGDAYVVDSKWIQKYNAEGIVQWMVAPDRVQESVLHSFMDVEIDREGDSYFLLHTRTTGIDEYGVRVISYDANGNLKYNQPKTLFNESQRADEDYISAYVWQIAADNSGNAYVVGYYGCNWDYRDCTRKGTMLIFDSLGSVTEERFSTPHNTVSALASIAIGEGQHVWSLGAYEDDIVLCEGNEQLSRSFLFAEASHGTLHNWRSEEDQTCYCEGEYLRCEGCSRYTRLLLVEDDGGLYWGYCWPAQPTGYRARLTRYSNTADEIWRTTLPYDTNFYYSGFEIDCNGDLITSAGGTITKYSSSNGAVLWSVAGGNRIALLSNGDVYAFDTVERVTCFDGQTGAQLWQYNPGTDLFVDNGPQRIAVDSNRNLYVAGANTEAKLVFARYKVGKQFEIMDATSNNDPIAEREVELYSADVGQPGFITGHIGSYSTDVDGAIEFSLSEVGELMHEDVGIGLEIGDLAAVSVRVTSASSPRHPILLPTIYSVWLDPVKFDEYGIADLASIDNQPTQEYVLDHTEYRYNLLVSVEWDADEIYLEGLRSEFRYLSNYLYDVGNGQIRLDTVAIYDNGMIWDQADIRIHASNNVHPVADMMGILIPEKGPIFMPRKWFGGNRERFDTHHYHPLGNAVSFNFRTMGHEFGHYALGYDDEYRFVDPVVRCNTEPNYGFMDYHYLGRGENSSEMSSSYRYVDPNCQNTWQWKLNGQQSSWDMFELWAEGTFNDFYVPIKKPDITDADEHVTPSGLDYVPGPNNTLEAPDFNVGSLVEFPVPVAPPAEGVQSLHIHVPSASVGGINIFLWQRDTDLNVTGLIDQGRTTDIGLIYVLGINTFYDYIDASGRSWQLAPTASKGAMARSVERTWQVGDLDLSTGKSLLGSSASLSPAEDSVELVLYEVDGYFPIICDASIAGGSVTYSIQAPVQSLPAEPDVELIPSHGGVHTSAAPSVTGGYEASITDTLGSSGMVRVLAEDNSAHEFYFPSKYELGLVNHDSMAIKVIGPDGGSELTLDTLNTSIDSVLILSSPYLVPLTGLSEDVAQGGQAHSVAVSPDVELAGVNSIAIWYNESDLDVGNGFVGNESDLQIYRWNDQTLQWDIIGGYVDTSFNYVASTITELGTYAAFSTNIVTDVEDDEHGDILPYRFELSQNYPNPFNPVTTIEYSLPRRSNVRIDIFNLLGQNVRTLVNREQSAGDYSITWDGRSASGESVSTGVYFYRFQAGDHVETKKMLLLK